MVFKDKFKCFKYLREGIRATWQDMWISLQVLVGLTIVLSIALYCFEHVVQPREYATWWDAIVWCFMSYLGDPGNFAPFAPISLGGRSIAIIVYIVRVMIFVVPAGVVSKGFHIVWEQERRRSELDYYHHIMRNSFHAGGGNRLKKHLAKLPQEVGAWYEGCQFGYVKSYIPASEFMLKGIGLSDVLAVCKEHPEFRVKNEANAKSIADGRQDRFIVEHFPVNTIYGYFIDRKSKVTIVSTSSAPELGIGNFSYYLAKFAGFNYISKDFNAADGESYYNNYWADPFYEGQKLSEYEGIPEEMQAVCEDKLTLRNAFLRDLESLCKDEDSWVICMLSNAKKAENVGKGDFLFTHLTSEQEGRISSIHTAEMSSQYDAIIQSFGKALDASRLNLSANDSVFYPLIKRSSTDTNVYRSLLFKLQDDGCKCSGFTIRVSRHLMLYNVDSYVALFELARAIHDVIEPNHRLSKDEVGDMNRTNRFRGFADQRVDDVKGELLKSEP